MTVPFSQTRTCPAGRSTPTVANGLVYVGSADFKVYALNASTGSKVWSFTTGDLVWSSPVVANGVVYVASDEAAWFTGQTVHVNGGSVTS